jgi:hypothetical protein
MRLGKKAKLFRRHEKLDQKQKGVAAYTVTP